MAAAVTATDLNREIADRPWQETVFTGFIMGLSVVAFYPGMRLLGASAGAQAKLESRSEVGPMRIVSRTSRSIREQEREKSMRKREAAGTLATAFPDIDQVRVHLRFVSNGGPAPAARTHALYRSAQAYFEFSCPHGDCDGSIDLNAVAFALLRKPDTQADGTLHCPGTRTGGGTVRPPCNQRVDYWIVATLQSLAPIASAPPAGKGQSRSR